MPDVAVVAPDKKRLEYPGVTFVSAQANANGCNTCTQVGWSSDLVRTLHDTVLVHPNDLPAFETMVRLDELPPVWNGFPNIATALRGILSVDNAFEVPSGAYDLLGALARERQVFLYSGGNILTSDIRDRIKALWEKCGFEEDKHYFFLAQSDLTRLNWAEFFRNNEPLQWQRNPVRVLQLLLPLDILAQGYTLAEPSIPAFPKISEIGKLDEDEQNSWFGVLLANNPSEDDFDIDPFHQGNDDALRSISNGLGGLRGKDYQCLRMILSRVASEAGAKTLDPSTDQGSGYLRLLWEFLQGSDQALLDEDQWPSLREGKWKTNTHLLVSNAHAEYATATKLISLGTRNTEVILSFERKRSRFSHDILYPRFLCALSENAAVIRTIRNNAGELITTGEIEAVVGQLRDALAVPPRDSAQRLIRAIIVWAAIREGVDKLLKEAKTLPGVNALRMNVLEQQAKSDLEIIENVLKNASQVPADGFVSFWHACINIYDLIHTKLNCEARADGLFASCEETNTQ